MSFFRKGLVIAAAVLVIDQIVKTLMLFGVFDVGSVADAQELAAAAVQGRPVSFPSIEILPIFSLSLVWNPGISFGLFPADSLWTKALLLAFQLGVVAYLLISWLPKVTSTWSMVGIGLIVGGAIGK